MIKSLRFLLLLNLLFSFYIGFGQRITNHKETIGNSSFEYQLMEPKETPKGILLLLPALGERPQDVFKNTDLPNQLALRGYLIIVPDLGYALIAEEYIMNGLTQILQVQTEKLSPEKRCLVIGGFSRGGAIAVRYAEYLLALDSVTHLKAVFAIDPALDLKRMYKSSVNKIGYECIQLIKREGVFIKNHLDNKLGGSPDDKPEAYNKYAAFSSDRVDGGNAKYLQNIPIRLYTEPDLDFVRKKYCNKLQAEDINAYDLEKLKEFLLKTGKSKCEYIATSNKGFHSWNILDVADCVEWIEKNCR